MHQSKKSDLFNKLVRNKYDIYNSLFLNLPYTGDKNIGNLIPLLYDQARKGLEYGENPTDILNKFLSNYTGIISEEDKIDFMFRVIQYVERQIVLFDSVEDAAFTQLKDLEDDVFIKDFYQFLGKNESYSSINEKLSSFSARLVFTAHPTQFYTPSVLDIMTKLRRLIDKNDINEIDLALQQLGLTSLKNLRKPTPQDEARNIMYYLRNIYYDAVEELYSYIKSEIRNGDFENPDIIKLGFWPGGDRDGNPFVTAEVTRNVTDELRMNLMKCYYEDIKDLQLKLTFRGIEEKLMKLRDNIYKCMFNPGIYMNFSEILNPLVEVKKILKDQYHNLYSGDLESLIDKVKIFRTHFASLDIRQDHRVHKKVIEAILLDQGLIKNNLNELSDEELTGILLKKDILINPDVFDDDIVRDTIINIRQIESIQEKNGEQGCNRYIISNSEDKFSVLFVFAMLRWISGSTDISVDIIPLFETLKGMEASESAMEQIFSLQEYINHVISRGNKQTIMLGFSDGTKDAGYMKANWAIFNTKESLSSICLKHDIKAIFFDGRGGPPARGGGKSHRFYASQTKEIANHEIQLTIQGQTITSKFGTREQFEHNCEQLLTAGLSRNIKGNTNHISEKARNLIDELSDISLKKYQQLKQHEQFIPYLENRSPLKYYSQANIASRPGKRGLSKKLTLSDLRAISFVGSWSQLKQNIPGYYGIGTAIKHICDQDRLEELQEAFKTVPVFKALILNGMMSLSKSNFQLTTYMAEDPEYGEFWKILSEEYELSKEMVLKISGYSSLLEEEPVSVESIKMREKIVLPLLIIQQHALQEVNRNKENRPVYEKIITRSLYGNINASRNSV